MAFILVPYTVSTGFKLADLSTVVYDILQAAVTVIWRVSMVILFVDVIIIRYRFHESFQAKSTSLQSKKSPGGMPPGDFLLCNLF